MCTFYLVLLLLCVCDAVTPLELTVVQRGVLYNGGVSLALCGRLFVGSLSVWRTSLAVAAGGLYVSWKTNAMQKKELS